MPNGPLPGLVAAYSFDEGSGTTVTDRSGNNNTGTLSNTSWSTSGKYGKALSFNGTNAWVTVPSSNSLGLTTGMTAEAWVNPSALGNAYRAVVFREQPGNEVYALYADQSGAASAQLPTGEVYVGGYKDANGTSGLALNSWTHLAETYDGSSVRLYVNGTLVSTTAAAGSFSSSSRPAPDRRQLDLGRVLLRPDRRGAGLQPAAERGRDPAGHDRARSRPTDTQPPTAPGNLAATRLAQLGQPQLERLERQRRRRRATTSTARRLRASRRARPTGSPSRPARATPTPALRAGTYYYKVQAEDAAGNLERVLERGERRRRRHDAALGPGHAERERGDRQGDAQLGRSQRQRRRRRATTSTARRPPASRPAPPTGSPSRAAPSYVDTTGARHLLLQGARRGRGRQPRPGLERGERGRPRRHHPAERARQPGARVSPAAPSTSAGAPRATTSA